MKNALSCLTLTAALAISGSASAHWFGKAEVEAKVSAAGYTVKGIKNGVGRYEVNATGWDGRTVVLYVSPWTGEITGQKDKGK